MIIYGQVFLSTYATYFLLKMKKKGKPPKSRVICFNRSTIFFFVNNIIFFNLVTVLKVVEVINATLPQIHSFLTAEYLN